MNYVVSLYASILRKGDTALQIVEFARSRDTLTGKLAAARTEVRPMFWF